MSEQPTTRLGRARMRAAGAKRGLAAVAAAGFVGALLLGRESHPGRSSSTSGVAGGGATTATPTATRSEDDGDVFGFDSGSSSIAPSTAVPQVQSGVS
jgi:hypothetical protein